MKSTRKRKQFRKKSRKAKKMEKRRTRNKKRGGGMPKFFLRDRNTQPKTTPDSDIRDGPPQILNAYTNDILETYLNNLTDKLILTHENKNN